MLCPDGPEQPTITARKAVEVNQQVELTCSATSVPPANYTWKLNGTATTTTAAVFIIASATYKDAGMYTCEAHNIITSKTASTSHNLSVRGECRHAAQTDHSMNIQTSLPQRCTACRDSLKFCTPLKFLQAWTFMFVYLFFQPMRKHQVRVYCRHVTSTSVWSSDIISELQRNPTSSCRLHMAWTQV